MNKSIKYLIEDYIQSFNPAVLDNGIPKGKLSIADVHDAVSDHPKTKLELRQLIEERIKEIKDKSYGATLDLSYINTSAITDMSELFKGIFTKKRSFITKIDFSGWDTSNVIDMSQMFFGCKDLRFLNLSQFDTSSVTNMNKMFYNCTKLWEIDVSSFDTSNVDNMSRMFQNCTDLESLDVTNFYIKKDANLQYMFYKCSGIHKILLFQIPIFTLHEQDPDEYYNTYNFNHALKGVDRSILTKKMPKWLSDYYMNAVF